MSAGPRPGRDPSDGVKVFRDRLELGDAAPLRFFLQPTLDRLEPRLAQPPR